MDPTQETLELLVAARLRQKVRTWQAEGDLPQHVADGLLEKLPEPKVPERKRPPKPSERADRFASHLPDGDVTPAWVGTLSHVFRDRDDWQRRANPHDDVTADAAAGAGGALFARGDTGALTGGLHTLAELDVGDASLRSVIGEYVWWFIGTLLVLGGSVMGVREAWLALGGIPRLLVVAAALLAYHGGFVALSSVVAKKSGTAGRVLAGIALTLLPVVFAALSALVALAPVVGLITALGVTGVVAFTVRTISRRFEGDPFALGLAFIPPLLAELPLSLAQLPLEARVALPLVGVLACGLAARRGFAALGLALYGLVALGVFTVVGAPGLPAVALDFGTFGFTALTGWAAAVALAVVPALATAEARKAFPHAAQAGEVVALAIAAVAGIAAFSGALATQVGADARADTFSALVPLIAAAAFAVVRAERRHAIHPAVMLALCASMLVARLEWRGNSAGWMLGPAAVGALLFVSARFGNETKDRVLLGLWGAAAGLFAIAAAHVMDDVPMRATAIAAALVALGAHGTGGYRHWPAHYAGGFAVLLGLEAWATPLQTPLWLAGAACAYLAVGLLWALKLDAEQRLKEPVPFHDLSLLAVLAAAALVGPALLLSAPPQTAALLTLPAAGLAAAVLLARTPIDRSRAVAAVAMIALGTLSYVPLSRFALTPGLPALALAALAGVRGRAEGGQRPARKVLGLFPLPYGARGRLLWGDGFAVAALVFVALTTLQTVVFLFNLDEVLRGPVVIGGAAVLGAGLLAFFTRGFASFGARGHFITWCTCGLLVVLVALANRLGRPLPPQVVGLRFSFIVPALWLFAIATRRFGPKVSQWLENPTQGALYHWVPHAGVGALGLLCVFEGLIVGGSDPTAFLATAPPLLFAAGALACLLLGRSFNLAALSSAGLGLLVIAAALAGAQQSLTGPELVQLRPGAGWSRVAALPLASWLWQRAALGVAVLAAAYAALAMSGAFPRPRALLARALFGTDALTVQPLFPKLLAVWSERAAFLVFAAALLQPRPLSAGLVVAAAVLLRLAAEKKAAGRVALLGFGALHASLAVATGVVPLWAGPSAAAVAAAVALYGTLRGADEDQLLRAHVAASVLSVAGVVWALATSGLIDVDFAMPAVLASSGAGLWAAWPTSPALPASLALAALAQLVLGAKWQGALQRWTLAAGLQLAALATAASVVVALEPGVHAVLNGDFVYGRLLALDGGPAALALVSIAVAAHLASMFLRDANLRAGFGLGRDWVGALAGLQLATFIATGDRSQLAFATAGTALAALFLVSTLEALRGKTGRHAWAAQVALVGGYALVQAQWRDLPPALDAVFGLGFGFLLVGVTVLARRSGVAPVAKATRAFAALLPVVVALVFPSAATRDTALLAAASSLLYAVLATVEHNRFFGALAAVAANLALLVLALAQGLNGVEIFLAPLGILLLVLALLFKKTLPAGGRNAVQLIGALLLYAPAAVKLSFQLGEAAEASYAVAFGFVCLLGVAAGMVLQIRAYLAMGTLFLTLDVVANLVNAGLRDYRIGFVVLSATGLVVLASMVFATLKRDLVQAWVKQLRTRLRGWD